MVLSFFINPSALRNHVDYLPSVGYKDTTNHIPDEQIFVGDDTLALLKMRVQ